MSSATVRDRKRRAGGRASDGGGAALGKTQSYETHQVRAVKPEVAENRQQERYRLLGGQRKLSSKKRTKLCKTPIGASHVGLVRHDGGAHFTGVQSCANVWACPVCGPKIRSGKTEDVMEAIDLHTAAGGGFIFRTATIAHTRAHRLAELLDVLGEMMTYISRQRAFKEWRERLGIIGSIEALEDTYGVQFGWHPHRHGLIMTDRLVTPDEVAAFESVLDDLQRRFLRKKGWKLGPERVGMRLDYVAPGDGAVLGKYVTKLQVGFELTRSDLKQTRAAEGKGVMPLELLARAMGDQDGAAAAAGISEADALRLWHEYEQAMTGKSSVRFSKGLRARLGMEAAKTDQELAEEEVGGEAEVYVAAPLFRRMTKDGHRGRLLLVFARRGVIGVLELVHEQYGGRYVATEDEHLRRLVVGATRGDP